MITIEQLTTLSAEAGKTIKRLAQQLGDDSQPLTDKDIEDMIASPHTFLLLAKDAAGEIAGMVTLVVYRIPYTKKAIIEDLIVDEAYRGQGIASQLLRQALTLAAKEGAFYVDCTARPERIASNRLYEKLGFKRRDTNVYRLRLDGDAEINSA